MTLTDRHLDELKRERWRRFTSRKAHYVKLIRRGPAHIVPVAESAVRTNDWMAIVAIGEALIELDALGLKPLRRGGFIGVLMSTLVEEGRHEQALQVFDSLTEADRTFAKAWVLRARALAGLTRLKDARQSLAQALKLDPEVRDGRRLMGLIEAQRDLKPKFAEGAG
ncbi:MAG TPA: tetratricopeptide repeat protein, partial [Caulobacteraceae bacterium]